MTKVLVFESDPEFAGELRTELARLNCTVQVVDDGNVGLTAAAQDRPDLVLLSIELPRMNGFSVCNKLKKDSALKDIPLIIMSSESSDETFEQHKKLRTRAEDYVHKPIAFGELLEHIRRLIPLEGSGADSSDAIVIDDAALVLEDLGDEIDDVEMTAHTPAPAVPPGAPPVPFTAAEPPGPPPPPRPKRAEQKDTEIDELIGGAFDRLLGEDDEATVVKPLHAIHPEIAALQVMPLGQSAVPAPPPAPGARTISTAAFAPPAPPAAPLLLPRTSGGPRRARPPARPCPAPVRRRPARAGGSARAVGGSRGFSTGRPARPRRCPRALRARKPPPLVLALEAAR
ncbi:MAG: response regulator [Polyangiaceae bacterium]